MFKNICMAGLLMVIAGQAVAEDFNRFWLRGNVVGLHTLQNSMGDYLYTGLLLSVHAQYPAFRQEIEVECTSFVRSKCVAFDQMEQRPEVLLGCDNVHQAVSTNTDGSLESFWECSEGMGTCQEAIGWISNLLVPKRLLVGQLDTYPGIPCGPFQPS